MTMKLLARYVHFPEGSSLCEIVDGFDACWGFPQVAGAIDGTHKYKNKPRKSTTACIIAE